MPDGFHIIDEGATPATAKQKPFVFHEDEPFLIHLGWREATSYHPRIEGEV